MVCKCNKKHKLGTSSYPFSMLFIVAVLICVWLIRLINIDRGGTFGYILMLGLLVKIILLIGTCTDVIPLMSAHSDADMFDDIARSNQGQPFGSWEFATNYTIFLTILYSITDCSRWFAQFLNMLMSMFSLIYLRKILFLLDMSMNIRKIVLIVVTFLPFLNNYALILGRESWEFMFVTISLYHFVCWYLRVGSPNLRIFLCVMNLLMAILMHAGIIGIFIGYFIAFLGYDFRTNKLRLTKASYTGLFFLLMLAGVVLMYSDVFLAKLMAGGNMEYINYKSTSEKAESAYLTWLEYSSFGMVLLFSPLKMFYFMFSPIFFNWRGINDALAFLFDSTVYIVAVWLIFTRCVENVRYRMLKKLLVISFFITTFIFSFGTNSAGDAIRHREKCLCIMLIAAALSTQKKSANKVKKYYKQIN